MKKDAKNIIHLISGPRNISTAMMYSFDSRSDTQVLDEPFYAAYLDSHPNVEHPGRDEILQSQNVHFDEVLDEILNWKGNEDFLFLKNMAHHLHERNWNFLDQFKNVFLIRDPKDLICSFARVVEFPTMLDIGLQIELNIYNFLNSNDVSCCVVDAAEVTSEPRTTLQRLCEDINIPFDEAMLSWSAGPKKVDGVWAKYWYANVHRSTHFSSKKLSDHSLPSYLQPLYEEASEIYQFLKSKRL